MSGAQIAHYLKVVGNGKEAAGIIAVYHAGWLVGIRQTLMVINAGMERIYLASGDTKS